MRPLRPFAVAWTALVLGVMPAAADTTAIQLTPSWQKFATPNTNVDIQNTSTGLAFLTTVYWCQFCGTTEPSPPASSAIGPTLAPGEHRCISMSYGDLYLKGTASIVEMDGLTCGREAY